MANQIGDIMGIKAEAGSKKVAFVHCAGSADVAKNKYEYSGIEDCSAMAYVPGAGPKTCKYGCLGYGSCVKACPFDAIHIVDGVAKVDREACKASLMLSMSLAVLLLWIRKSAWHAENVSLPVQRN